MAAGKLYTGTAGWANPPAERDRRAPENSHLQYYAAHFNAVEINSSFYRSHARATYERWRASTPAGFRFSVKAPRSITHDSDLKHCRKELHQFLQETAGLGKKLRVILVQTPASLGFDRPVATRFFKSLTAQSPARIALEPRHPSWFEPRAQATLRELNVSRVAADPAKCHGAGSPPQDARLVYYRLHGSPRMYYSAYTEEYLANLSKQIQALRTESKEVWCMFDNTARHASWDNALSVTRAPARRRRVSAP
jgi:uncharacterized protein YecE (DUF72 family)